MPKKSPKLRTISSQKTQKPDQIEHIILVCACGCRTWYLHQDGTAHCAECDKPPDPALNDARWYQNLPEPPIETPPRPPQNKSCAITVFNDPHTTISRILNSMERRWERLCAHMAIYDDGHISVYCRDTHRKSDPSDVQWYRDRLEDARKMIMQETPE